MNIFKTCENAYTCTCAVTYAKIRLWNIEQKISIIVKNVLKTTNLKISNTLTYSGAMTQSMVSKNSYKTINKRSSVHSLILIVLSEKLQTLNVKQ